MRLTNGIIGSQVDVYDGPDGDAIQRAAFDIIAAGMGTGEFPILEFEVGVDDDSAPVTTQVRATYLTKRGREFFLIRGTTVDSDEKVDVVYALQQTEAGRGYMSDHDED